MILARKVPRHQSNAANLASSRWTGVLVSDITSPTWSYHLPSFKYEQAYLSCTQVHPSTIKMALKTTYEYWIDPGSYAGTHFWNMQGRSVWDTMKVGPNDWSKCKISNFHTSCGKTSGIWSVRLACQCRHCEIFRKCLKKSLYEFLLLYSAKMSWWRCVLPSCSNAVLQRSIGSRNSYFSGCWTIASVVHQCTHTWQGIGLKHPAPPHRLPLGALPTPQHVLECLILANCVFLQRHLACHNPSMQLQAAPLLAVAIYDQKRTAKTDLSL